MIERPQFFDEVLLAANALQYLVGANSLPKDLRLAAEEAWEGIMEAAASSQKEFIASHGDWRVEFYFSANSLNLMAAARHPSLPKNEPICLEFWHCGTIVNIVGCNSIPNELARIIRQYVPNE